jgi:hypothetical protein
VKGADLAAFGIGRVSRHTDAVRHKESQWPSLEKNIGHICFSYNSLTPSHQSRRCLMSRRFFLLALFIVMIAVVVDSRGDFYCVSR